MNKQKINQIVGSIGAFIGIIVFIAYIPQIIANLQGNKAQPFQPLSAAISCLIWVIYGWTKEPKKDWILIIPNSACTQAMEQRRRKNEFCTMFFACH